MKKVSLKTCKELIKKHFANVSTITYLYDSCITTDTGRDFVIVTDCGVVKHICIWCDKSMCITDYIIDHDNEPRWIEND